MNAWWYSSLGNEGCLFPWEPVARRVHYTIIFYPVNCCVCYVCCIGIFFQKIALFLGKAEVFGVEGVDFDYSKLFLGEK